MVSSSTHLTKPKDWDDFERKITVLAQEWLNDPHAEGNGRQGQSQAGVDIFGRRNGKLWIGIQCKKKWETQVTEKELRAEVEKAQNFKPKLSEFILATTAPRDKNIQKIANELTEANIGFSVHVWGWERIEELVSGYDRAIKEFDPAYHPTLSADIKVMGSQIDALQELIQSTSIKSTNTGQNGAQVTNELDDSTVLHGKISAIQSLIEDEEILPAERQIEKLISNEWEGASSSEKYRMLVVKANILLNREFFEEGGRLLLKAFSECPEHKNANRNRSIGLLICGDPETAIQVAEEILLAEPNDRIATDTLVQARYAVGLDDPFCDIKDEVINSIAIATLKTQIARENKNIEWRNLAKLAKSKYPDSKFAKRYCAEAIIDEVITDAPAYIAGEISSAIDFSLIFEAASILGEQVKFLDSIEGYVPSALAHNAALAYRLIDNTSEVLSCLEIGFRHNPDDCASREQLASCHLEEGNFQQAIELLEDKEISDTATLVLSAAKVDAGLLDEAEALIEGYVPPQSEPGKVHNFLSVKYGIFRERKKLDEAIKYFAKYAEENSSSIVALVFHARVCRLSGELKTAHKLISDVSEKIDGDTTFSVIRDAANEAFKLEQYDLVVSLLSERVASDHDNGALFQCIAASLNGNMLRSATSLFDKMPAVLKEQRWVRRSQIILAQRVGDPKTVQHMGGFLKDFPNDAEMRLARIGLWQRDGFEANIRRDLQNTDFDMLEGSPVSKMEFLQAATHFGQAEQGVKAAYSLLLENWHDSSCHMIFQGIFIANNDMEGLSLRPTKIGLNTTIKLATDSGEKKYRIEEQRPMAFGDEWLGTNDQLTKELLGKKVDDIVVINKGLREENIRIVEVKSVFLDTFHQSVEDFNTRFPNSNGMMRFSFDETSDDPFAEIREVTKQGVERDTSMLEFYRDNNVPMSFLASMLGKDEIDCAIGVPNEGIPFKVCRGLRPERENALEAAKKLEKTGIVVDPITLSVIHKLNLSKAVTAVCGPLYTPQTTFDLFAKRLIEAKQALGRQPGSLSYRNGKLVLTETTDEHWQEVITHRAGELKWMRGNVEIVECLPQEEIFGEARAIIDLVGTDVCAPAIAANGAQLPLLSDDFGFRTWSEHSFQLQGFWLQPILMAARDWKKITDQEYCEALCQMTNIGFEFISLDVNCFLYKLRSDKFMVTAELKKMLGAIGGKQADLPNNLGVAANIIDALIDEPCEDYQRFRFASEVITSFTKTRWDNAETVILALAQRCNRQSEEIAKHLIGWLVGHSIGSKEFQVLRNKYKI